jgi:hypothetical protein
MPRHTHQAERQRQITVEFQPVAIDEVVSQTAGSLQKQANCAVNRERRWNGDDGGPRPKLAVFGI